MRVWNRGNWIEVEVGQKVFIGKHTLQGTLQGEYATLTRITKTQLVFKTESDQDFKTNNGLEVLGSKKAKSHTVWIDVPNNLGELVIKNIWL